MFGACYVEMSGINFNIFISAATFHTFFQHAWSRIHVELLFRNIDRAEGRVGVDMDFSDVIDAYIVMHNFLN